MKENLKKIVVLNTAANYASLLIKLVTAIFLTRLIFLGLGNVSYGFWALLWSIFGYSLLLDFGFGTSVQKYAAEVSVTNDFKTFNKLISTVITSYVMMSFVIAAVSILMTRFVDTLFVFPEGTDLDYYRKVLLFFGIGTAITFPTGTFAEILRGLKKIYIINFITILYMLVNFAGVYLIFSMEMSLFELTVFTILINLGKNIVMWGFAKRSLPLMSISTKHFSSKLLKEVLTFSLFAYLIMFANMIIYKTDQIVLGFMLGLEAVALYQVGSRLSDMMVQFSTQFQSNLTPIAAALYKNREFGRLNYILTNSNRLIALMSTFFFIIMTLLARQILFVWLKVNDPIVTYVAIIMNISMFLLVLFRSGSSKVLLMANRHKFLSIVALIEGALNVILSIIFIKMFGLIGVAYGTLIPNIILSVFVIFPVTCKFIGMSVVKSIFQIYLPVLINAAPATLFLYWTTTVYSLEKWTIFHLIGFATVAGILYVIPGFFFVLTKENRKKIYEIISRKSS